MRRNVACLLAAWGTATAIATAHAQPESAAPAPPPGRGTLTVPIHDGMLELSLENAVHLAIDRSLDVELLRIDPQLAEKDLGAAWGAYDPQLYGEGGYSSAETPTASQILGNTLLTQETSSGEAGLRGQIPWLGGSYQVGYQGSEVFTNSRISVLSPEFRASYVATLQIPLLRGLFWSDSWTLVRLSRIGVDLSSEQFRGRLMDVVRNTEDAYWGLIAAQDGERVAQKSLETAEALLDQTQAQYEVGVVSKVEVVQAEAGVADREFNLIRASAVARNTQDRLIDLVLGPYLEAETEIDVEATDRAGEITVREVSAAAATEHAMARLPELAVARKDIERRKIEVAAASNDRLPQLDLVGSYGKAGLSGRTNPDCVDFTAGVPCTDPPGVRTDFVDADRNFFNSTGAQNYSIAGVLSIPLGNNTARNLHDRAKLELRRSETAYDRLEQSIVSDIRRAARNLRSAVEGIEAATRAEAAAEEQLRAERVRLEFGESTPFEVLQREEDLVRAQGQKILAQQTYHNSITELDRAQGTILDRHQIVVEEAAALR
ncbi:MAG: TolC family protein [Myxococcota bacterium]|jgi:outer membrane protein TolC|nr:TolC family protein [Myxococcota bacterium]